MNGYKSRTNVRKHGKRFSSAHAEHEMSSYTFRSSTPVEMSETEMTWRYKSRAQGYADDDDLSAQLDSILNPDLDTHHEEKSILLILDKLTRSEKDPSYHGHALQHTLDELVYVITTFLIKKHKKPEKAIKKFKKSFEKSSDIPTWLIQREHALIYDSEKFDLKEYIGRDHEPHFWLTIHKLIIKYFQMDIELEKSPILHWPLVWSQTFKQALSRKVKEISPDKIIALSPNSRNKMVDRFDEANLHHTANKTAEDWYKEFLCKRDHKMDIKQKTIFAKQNKRVCDGCGHIIKTNKSDIKPIVMYTGGWPTEQKYIFHDEHCVKLRKYLEAIRQFVFDIDMYSQKHRQTSALTNWRRLLHLIQNKDYVLSINQKIPRPLRATESVESWSDAAADGSKQSKKYRTNYIPKADRGAFRRKRKLAQYHLQMDLIQATQHITRLNEFINGGGHARNAEDMIDDDGRELPPNDIYNENVDFELVYGLLNGRDVNGIPKIIRFMDIAKYGPSIFVYCLRSLEIKDRRGLWIIIQFIMRNLPTSSAISLLILHKNELLRFPKDNLNKLCLKVIQCSQFPIATSLYLCGYMSSCFELCGNKECREFAELYTKIAIELCLFIESDHLLAILLEIPSDISELSILDICIEYKLTDFLYSHRLRPIFNQMWTQFKYLDPSKSFEMKRNSYLNTFHHLLRSPSCFYYSPQGLFITEVLYYLAYMIIFTLWIMDLQYPYNLPITTLETILWIENGGYLVKEFMEAVYKKNSYFAHGSKYFDLLIVLNWIVIAAIRWPWAWLTWQEYIIYDDQTGEMDVIATKNQALTIAYMICVGIQCILIWTRSILYLQRSKKTGPLIHTIFRLLSDVWQFTIVLALFLFGCMFALYYLIGGDMGSDLDGELLLYMFQALLGQHDWDLLKESEENGFGDGRSKIAEIIVVFFSIIGNIALLNLLIALMASVYEANSPLTAKQVNYAAIVNTIELVNKEALLPSPFNLVVIAGLLIYFVAEMLIYFVTCSRWSYNISRIGWTKYALNRDWVDMEQEEMDKLEKPQRKAQHKKQSKYESVSNKRLSDTDTNSDDDDVKYDDSQRTTSTLATQYRFWSCKDEEMLSRYEEQRDIVYKEHRFWQKKEFSSINCSSLSGSRKYKMYCRFCRNRMISKGDIAIYLYLYRHFKALDESDKALLIHLSNDKILCPSCFRPVKFYTNKLNYDGDSQRLWRWQVAQEIISFYVFMMVAYLPLLLLLAIPALFSWCGARFTSWSSNFTNDSETNAKYKQQVQLNGDNVIFGNNYKSNEYKHVSHTIHREYGNFIKTKQNEGSNFMILPLQQDTHTIKARHENGKQTHGVEAGHVLSTVEEQTMMIDNNNNLVYGVTPIKPVHVKLFSQKKYSNELSPVVDSPLPHQHQHHSNTVIMNNNDTYKEILLQLTEIQKEVATLKKYSKKSIALSKERRDSNSKPTSGMHRSSSYKKQYKSKKNMDEKQEEHEHEQEKEESIRSKESVPSMPSMPPSLQIQDSDARTAQSHRTMKPSKQQQRHDALSVQRNSPQADLDIEYHEMNDMDPQHTLHDIIDTMSVGSMMTATTAMTNTSYRLQ
eukprot:643133_1